MLLTTAVPPTLGASIADAARSRNDRGHCERIAADHSGDLGAVLAGCPQVEHELAQLAHRIPAWALFFESPKGLGLNDPTGAVVAEPSSQFAKTETISGATFFRLRSAIFS
jgi:hypothetical protein